MSDENAENPVEEVVEEVTETTVEPAAEVVETETGGNDRPGWVDEIIDAIHGISAPVTETVETVHEETPNPEAPEIPDGAEVPDETPTKKPWTHKWFGS